MVLEIVYTNKMKRLRQRTLESEHSKRGRHQPVLRCEYGFLRRHNRYRSMRDVDGPLGEGQ